MADMWLKEDVILLIDLFKNQQLLWNPRHADYMRRGARILALRKIASRFPGKGKILIALLFIVKVMLGQSKLMNIHLFHYGRMFLYVTRSRSKSTLMPTECGASIHCIHEQRSVAAQRELNCLGTLSPVSPMHFLP
jgi:Alcohol dehydrogenase transcription factor Myb/SANT-like